MSVTSWWNQWYYLEGPRVGWVPYRPRTPHTITTMQCSAVVQTRKSLTDIGSRSDFWCSEYEFIPVFSHCGFFVLSKGVTATYVPQSKDVCDPPRPVLLKFELAYKLLLNWICTKPLGGISTFLLLYSLFHWRLNFQWSLRGGEGSIRWKKWKVNKSPTVKRKLSPNLTICPLQQFHPREITQ